MINSRHMYQCSHSPLPVHEYDQQTCNGRTRMHAASLAVTHNKESTPERHNMQSRSRSKPAVSSTSKSVYPLKRFLFTNCLEFGYHICSTRAAVDNAPVPGSLTT